MEPWYLVGINNSLILYSLNICMINQITVLTVHIFLFVLLHFFKKKSINDYAIKQQSMRKEAFIICCSASNHVNWLQVTLFI